MKNDPPSQTENDYQYRLLLARMNGQGYGWCSRCSTAKYLVECSPKALVYRVPGTVATVDLHLCCKSCTALLGPKARSQRDEVGSRTLFIGTPLTESDSHIEFELDDAERARISVRYSMLTDHRRVPLPIPPVLRDAFLGDLPSQA